MPSHCSGEKVKGLLRSGKTNPLYEVTPLVPPNAILGKVSIHHGLGRNQSHEGNAVPLLLPW